MRIFVTGATGVLGRRVVPRLLEAGHEVTAVARTFEKRATLNRQGARALDVDLFDPTATRAAIGDAEVILNLATAVPKPGLGMFFARSWREMDRVRRVVSKNLVDAALGGDSVKRFVQESFAPIYANGGDFWLDESSVVHPVRYNRSVLDAEANAERMTRAGRVGVVLRFGMFYGEDDPLTRMLIQGVRYGIFPLIGPPDAYVSFIEHGDAASAVIAALSVPAGIYDAVDDEPLRRRDLAERVADKLGKRPPLFLPAKLERVTGSLGETSARSLRISNRKLRQMSDFSPRYRNAAEGMAAIIGRPS
jgi:nucleoside-diphosphate-sugar epimerase